MQLTTAERYLRALSYIAITRPLRAELRALIASTPQF